MSAPDQILLDIPSLLLSYSAPEQLLRAQWRGRFDAASARSQCEMLLEHLLDRPCRRMINDSSEAFGEWWEAGKWIGQVFAPELAARGVRAVAWINAMDWPSRYAVASTVPLVKGLIIKAFDFDEQRAAHEWVTSIEV
ncbi:STAS/SEC14 domain-containing protein [Hymenobacter rubripertinctus]|uniref:STAS/SEC14 domain-containing protein n=1 Tax=Hymenobacter rubripertinctus TaxID=2029981 RepID=A0A418QPT6_9BACT|nr:STAS/SEC14 domain-containing protein [Hymenobacter rubripertinctus]RIY07219.1 hypothetical protein D0T11_16895 [Hymenobacter rubripertinctus]